MIGHELFGKELGLIGFGKIGREVASEALAFGIAVALFDPYLETDLPAGTGLHCHDSLQVLVRSANIVFLHLPLNESTRDLISMELIREAKLGLILINTSRAGIVNLDALMYGQKEKILGGYLTDVLEEEPMQENHLLLRFKNVLITPHLGSRT